MALTPHEQRKAKRLEAAKRKIEDFKRRGEVLPNGEIKLKDLDGTPFYVHPELIEGVGRYGEPTFALVEYKRRTAGPVLEMDSRVVNMDAASQPKLKHAPGRTVMSLGEPPGSSQGISTSGGDGSGGDGKGKQGGKPPKDGR